MCIYASIRSNVKKSFSGCTKLELRLRREHIENTNDQSVNRMVMQAIKNNGSYLSNNNGNAKVRKRNRINILYDIDMFFKTELNIFPYQDL